MPTGSGSSPRLFVFVFTRLSRGRSASAGISQRCFSSLAPSILPVLQSVVTRRSVNPQSSAASFTLIIFSTGFTSVSLLSMKSISYQKGKVNKKNYIAQSIILFFSMSVIRPFTFSAEVPLCSVRHLYCLRYQFTEYNRRRVRKRPWQTN